MLKPFGSFELARGGSLPLGQLRRKRVLGTLSARTLVIVIALAAIGLGRVHQARAQEDNAINAYGLFLMSLSNDEISDICEDKDGIVDQACVKRFKAMRALLLALSGPGKSLRGLPSHLLSSSRAEASASSISDSTAAFSPTLESSVPTLPFLGNWLTVLSWVPNAADAADATGAYAVGLTRQSDCSLDEEFVLPGAGLPEAEYFTSLTSAQDYFHQISGLTTTPDVFANGCAPQVLGLPASNTGQSLGETSDGAAIGAQLSSPGLYVTITDLTANTVTNTQVTSGSDPGAFYAASLRSNGITDLVETGLTDPANSAPATAVLLGNGDGTFKTPVYYDVSADSYALAAGFTVDDVNGDGIPDIVILNSTNTTYGTPITLTGTVTTLIGKGDGTFTIGPVSNLTWTDSLQVQTGVFKTGDVKDLLVGGTVLFGAGNGSFTQALPMTR